ncbi:MAG: sulfurtransferase TusA family protein [Gammaproteobacteria bacterium]|nr:sulfurtransferase TusA family protein [Gammaproteobacteria bacterium]
MSHSTLDARNLNCPLPILRTRKALNGLANGDTLEVLATDPGSVKDIDSFCKQTGNTLVSTNEQQGQYTFVIRKN